MHQRARFPRADIRFQIIKWAQAQEARGVLDTKDLVFFCSVIFFPLAIAFRGLESRRWK